MTSTIDNSHGGSQPESARDNQTQLQRRYANLCRAAGHSPFQKLLQCIDDDVVELRGQKIGSLEAMTCLTALQASLSLTSLTLDSNNLGDSGATQVAQFLRESVCLIELRIRENQVGAKGLSAITEALATNRTVLLADLSENQFDHNCGKFIRHLLERNERLRELVLKSNQFDSAGTVDIAHGLAHNQALQLIDLSWNQIRCEGAICLCDSFAVNEDLETALLGNNGLGIQGCKSLAKSLVKNETLKVLDLTSNRIDARCLEYLVKGLQRNSTLKSLKLSQNPLPVDVLNGFLSQFETKGLTLQSLDCTGLTVDGDTMQLANRIGSARSFSMMHGPVLKCKLKLKEEPKGINDDPMTLLMEFLRIKNLRLVDLFMSLDPANTRSIPGKTFRQGLVKLGFPASDQCLKSIVFIMDKDGDGQIDMSEVMGSMRSYRRRLHRIQELEKHVPYAETLVGRVAMKLEHALELQRKQMKEAQKLDKDK